MEAYDISNISGFESVGSMVVYEKGKPKRSDYRKFKIKWVQGPNDYASMEEVLTRRFTHESKGEFDSFSRLPDLILMDGGRGQVNIALNGYYTQWMDKSLRRKIGQEYANLTGLDAVHMGVELEATYRPVKSFELKGMFSLGDWKWKDDIHFTMYDEANNPIGTYDAYLKDVHVGNSAQLTSALSASWEPFKGFKISADYNFFGKNYADFDPQNRVNEADAGIDSWKLPDYGTIDLGMNYRFNITKDIRAIVYSNVYNLTNTEYIADAKDGTNHDWKTALVYYGFGTTWSAGFKVIF